MAGRGVSLTICALISLNFRPTAAEASQQTDHEPIEPESFSMDEDPHESSPSMAAEDDDDDAVQATTDSGASERVWPLPEHDDGSSSDASIPLSDLSDTTSMEGDSDSEEEPSHAPKVSGDVCQYFSVYLVFAL